MPAKKTKVNDIDADAACLITDVESVHQHTECGQILDIFLSITSGKEKLNL